MTRHVDLHCHYVPPSILDRIERDRGRHSVTVTPEGRVSFTGRATTQPWPRGMNDLADRIEWMDAQGVDIQVLSAWMDFSAYVLDPEDGAWLARSLNELTQEAIVARPDRFLAMAAVPLQAPELAAEELRHAIGELGMVAVEIGTRVLDRELDDPGLTPFWTVAEDLDVMVLVHPPNASIGHDRLRRYFFDNIVSNPAEETVAAAHLIFGGVLERHPNLRVCLTHGGGFLPYQIGRQDRGYHGKVRDAASVLSRPPSSYLRRFFYDTVVHSAESLTFLVGRVGGDRVVLGSDYPFPMGDPEPVASVRRAGLAAPVEQAILHDNAIAALGPAVTARLRSTSATD